MGDVWVIELLSADDDVPDECRVRRILKFAWRQVGMKAIGVARQPAKQPARVKPEKRTGRKRMS